MLYHDDIFIKAKLKTYGDKMYTNFSSLNVPEDGVECDSFAALSIHSLLVYESRYYIQVYLDHCAYKIVEKQMTDYLDDNLFETDEISFFLF